MFVYLETGGYQNNVNILDLSGIPYQYGVGPPMACNIAWICMVIDS